MRKLLMTSVAVIGLVSAFAGPAHAKNNKNKDKKKDPVEIVLSVAAPSANPLTAMTGDLSAFEGDLSAFHGDLSAFWGDLSAFEGGLSAFEGDLSAFEGGLSAFHGDLSAFWGDLSAFEGDLSAFEGDLSAFEGGLSAFWGDLSAFEGGLSAFHGDLSAFEGDLSAFHGDLSAFHGDLSAFWGDLSAFWGDLSAFHGDLSAFEGGLSAFEGDLSAFEGDLSAFWGDLSAFEGGLSAFEGGLSAFEGDLSAFDQLQAGEQNLSILFNHMIANSEAQFGFMVQAITGQDFKSGFATNFLAQRGITYTAGSGYDTSVMTSWSDAERAMFFIDYYDNLMMYSGIDRVDHWMTGINWSPALAADHDLGNGSIIGLIDFGVTDGGAVNGNVTYRGGYENDGNDNHGSAVVSLISAPVDGFGLMGVAPGVEIVSYNPFDETNTASFNDVKNGIIELAKSKNANIINMSLGKPGSVLSQDWANVVMHNNVQARTRDALFVKAAGNEGVAQSENVTWKKNVDRDRILLVGALGLDGQIAEFSNTPGDACLVVKNKCAEDDKLMYRFLVAPGEFMLVSDGQGGVTRASGTSFAAPLVSGAAALVNAYWPWLESKPEVTAHVLLHSADDLGAPGVDEVYGYGALNVEAALSPLDFNDLTFFSDFDGNGNFGGGQNASAMRNSFLNASTLQLQDAAASVVAFEKVETLNGVSADRDFRIPLSTLVYNERGDFGGNGLDRSFQRHLHQRFVDWANGATSFSDIDSVSAPLGLNGEWTMAMTATPYAPGHDVRDGELPFQSDVQMANVETGTHFRVGFGEGAALIGKSDVFGLYSDHDRDTGGVNPFLGFASGGAYANAGFNLTPAMSLTVGITETSDDHTVFDTDTGGRRELQPELSDYAATAANVELGYQMSEAVSLKFGYTQLNETDAVLGDQGTGAFGFGGAVTDAVTTGVEAKAFGSWTFGASATLGNTQSVNQADRLFGVSDEGLTSTAFALGVHKLGIFNKTDQARISLSQPLAVENGKMTYTSVQVVDRQTGELGVVTDEWALKTDRNFVGEAFYATQLMNGDAEFSTYTRVEKHGITFAGQDELDMSVGGRFAIKY